MKLAIAKLRNSLEQPEMQSTILQDGFRSQFLYNDSRVLWSNVGSLLFSQIRSLQKFGTYYHVLSISRSPLSNVPHHDH